MKEPRNKGKSKKTIVQKITQQNNHKIVKWDLSKIMKGFRPRPF